MNRSRKDMTMMAAMAGLMLFAAFNFLYKPQRSELSSASSELRSVEQSVSDAELLMQTPVTTTTIVGVEPGAALPAIPEDMALTQLLRQLQGVADQTGVTVAAITPTQLSENPSGPGGSMGLAITASGPHDSLRAYVQGLRDLERLLVIEQISITAVPPVADQPAQPDQLQLSARVFTLVPPPSAVAIPTETSKP
ncbi:MAG: hypothetical protein ABI706_10145 [Ilumatobacteraceae bacterium]